jgi:hypothetical protein
MATSGITSNIDAVKDALKIYGLVVRKDADAETKKKMASIAYESARFTPFGEKGALRAEISNLPLTKDGGKKRYGNTAYVGQYKLINWQRKLAGLLPVGGSKFRKVKQYKVRPGALSVEEREIKRRNRVHATLGPSLRKNPFMDGKYKAFIAKRIRSIKFIRAAWSVAAVAFGGKPFSRGDFGQNALARFSGLAYGGGEVKPIGPDITEYSIFNGAGKYDTRRVIKGVQSAPERPAKDQERASQIIEEALNKGVAAVLADITQYFEARADRVMKAIRVLNRFR